MQILSVYPVTLAINPHENDKKVCIHHYFFVHLQRKMINVTKFAQKKLWKDY
jgi:hypothetical protein